jgi:thymidylate kinase
MKNNIIIFEGTDSCGKTNISHAFAAKYPSFDYFKLEKEKLFIKTLSPEQIRLMHENEIDFFLSFLKQVHVKVIMDRNYPSEIVYGRLFRTVDEELMSKVDAEFAELGTKIVLLTKDDSLLRDDIFNKPDLLKIKKGYEQFAKETKCEILTLDTSDFNLDEQIKKIETFIYG